MKIHTLIAATLIAFMPMRSGTSQVRGTWSYPFGPNASPNGPVFTAVVDRSGGLYIAGSFTAVGSIPVRKVAYWNGSDWSGLETGASDGAVLALAMHGDTLYLGGTLRFSESPLAVGLASWNGVEWRYYGHEWFWVSDLLASGDAVYAGGGFGSMIARWDGVGWRQLAYGMKPEVEVGNLAVRALAGSGKDLYVAGSFIHTYSGDREFPNGIEVNRIARWDGTAWTSLGTGMNGDIRALAFDGEGGLVAAGSFTLAGGIPANGVARWNGSTWEPLGLGLGPGVGTLALSGGSIFAGGDHLGIDSSGNPAFLMRWTGSTWEAIDDGPNGYIDEVLPSGDSLIVVGEFTRVGSASAPYIAVWKPTGSSSAEPEQLIEQAPTGIGIEVFPNPSTGPVTVRLLLDQPCSVRFEFYNLLGSLVEIIPVQQFGVGESLFSWDASGHAAGPILIRMVINETDAKTFFIMRMRLP